MTKSSTVTLTKHGVDRVLQHHRTVLLARITFHNSSAMLRAFPFLFHHTNTKIWKCQVFDIICSTFRMSSNHVFIVIFVKMQPLTTVYPSDITVFLCVSPSRRQLWCMFKRQLQRSTIQMFNLLRLRSVRIVLWERCDDDQTHHRASNAVYINQSRLW